MNAFKEAARKKKTAPGGAEKEVPEVIISEETPDVKKESAGEIQALLSGIEGERRPQKKSSTLYLSTTNLGELKKRAKKAGVSSSEFLDKVLTKLFEEA